MPSVPTAQNIPIGAVANFADLGCVGEQNGGYRLSSGTQRELQRVT